MTEKITISLTLGKHNIEKVLNKKHFQNVPVSDDDFLLAIFAYGLSQCVLDNPEFKIFTAMMIKQGIISKIHDSNIY